MDGIAPKFSPPVLAPSLISGNDPRTERFPDLPGDEEDSLQPSTGQVIAGVVIIGGLWLGSRGKISPERSGKIVRWGVKGIVGLGGGHLITGVGGHNSDTAHRPPRPAPIRPSPIPDAPTQPPRKPPTPSIGQSIVMGVYREGFRHALSQLGANGVGLDFIEIVMRLVGPVKAGKPAPGGASPQTDIIPAALFSTIADVAGNKPGGIVNNLTRQGVNDNIGNGITLVAQCGDP